MGGRKGIKVCGIGINDADYKVTEHKDERVVWVCPYYQKWVSMLKRCYSADYQKRQPTYIGCTVCEEWIYFMNFRAWMITQDWEGKELDKDMLLAGNKVYSPDTCIFIHKIVNTFTIDCGAAKGKYPTGVFFHDGEGRLRAACSNPFTKKQETLGRFSTPEEAHQAWRKRKHELACQLADSEYVTDERVANALRTRYSN